MIFASLACEQTLRVERDHEVVLTTIAAADGTAGQVTISAFEVGYARSSTIFVIVSGVAALLALGAIARVVQVLGRLRRTRAVRAGEDAPTDA